ncbi:hypothetical protein [Streptomyces sp. NBC_00498]
MLIRAVRPGLGPTAQTPEEEPEMFTPIPLTSADVPEGRCVA